MLHRFSAVMLVLLVAASIAPDASAQERLNPLIALLEAGKPAVGVRTAAIASPRLTKVLATSDVDFIMADIEHEVYDFNVLRSFLLGVQDFGLRFRPRGSARSAPPVVLVKLANRATWDPRYEIAASLKVGLAWGVWIPFVESRADLERAISAVRHAETSSLGGLNIPSERRDVWPLNPKGELMVVAMIESEKGVENAREIIETPGLAAIETVHIPAEAEARILKMCLERKVAVMTHATPADAQAKFAAGYRLFNVGWDYELLQQSLADSVKGLRK